MSASRESLGSVLAAVSAVMNVTCAVLLVRGRRAIAGQARAAHRRLMLSAFGASSAFLTVYLARIVLTGTKKFVGPPWLTTVYRLVLFPHMLLAIVMVPMILAALWLATRGRFAAHRWIARRTYPVWLYVSITGVLVYVLLYHVSGRVAG
jgi:putative membrane protein